MASTSGGIAAALGFRYQYLVTVEVLLDLYSSPAPDWRVGVDLAQQDSADVLVWSGQATHRAIQVKASAPTSSTTISLPDLKRYFEAMQSEHPRIAVAQVITNRPLSPPAQAHAKTLGSLPRRRNTPRLCLDARQESMEILYERLIHRIAQIRATGVGGTDSRVHYLLLSRLLDLVGERGSRNTSQTIERPDLAAILESPASVLAAAAGSRAWGRTFGVPLVDAVTRPHIEDFLSAATGSETVETGSTSVAVVVGLSGTGKSTAVARWASLRRENYAFTLWLDASSEEVLVSQHLRLHEMLGQDPATDHDPAASFRETLGSIPAPWLLVLDGAQSYRKALDWIPVSGYGHVIVTSNTGDWPADVAPQLHIDEMSPADAVALVRHRLPSRADVPAVTDQIIREFTRKLGDWPLAVDVACAWVVGLRGDLSTLPDFIARLDRFPFGTDHPTGVSYPRSMAAVFKELREALSPGAQTALFIIVSNAGKPVPVRLLEQWAGVLETAGFPIEGDMRHLLNELTGSSLVRMQFLAHTRPNPFDEVVTVHEGIQALLKHEGFEVPINRLTAWLETVEAALGEEAEAARMPEVALILETADGFLSALAASYAARSTDREPMLLLRSTITMHNVGLSAALLGDLDRARTWYAVALNLRDELRPDPTPARPNELQLQTLSSLVYVLVRQDDLAPIPVLAERAIGYLPPGDPIADASIISPLSSIRDALNHIRLQGGNSELLPKFEALLDGRSATQLPDPDTKLGQHVDRHQELIQHCTQLAEMEQWSDAADLALLLADQAVDAQILLAEAVDALLDVGLLFIASLLDRPHELPRDSWKSAGGRIADWCTAHEEAFTSSQQIRASIFAACVQLDLDELDRLAREHEAGAATDQIAAWAKLGGVVSQMLRATLRFHALVGDHPEESGIIVHRTLNGGTAFNYWLAVSEEEPVVFISTASSSSSGGTTSDPFLGLLVANGFPRQLSADGRPMSASGWVAHLDHDGLDLKSPQGTVLAHIDEEEKNRPWFTWASTVDSVRVIYEDPADRHPAELIDSPFQAIISVDARSYSRRGGKWWPFGPQRFMGRHRRDSRRSRR